MVVYSLCPTAVGGGTCTDTECPNRHDISRCEPCNRTFLTLSLQGHQRGQRHLRNVARNGPPNLGGPQQPTSQPGLLNAQLESVPLPSTLPPSGGDVQTHAADPRVVVSDEGGLDFIVEGTMNAGNPSFSSADIMVSITKTEVMSYLSVQNVAVAPLPNSACELFYDIPFNALTLLLAAFLLLLLETHKSFGRESNATSA